MTGSCSDRVGEDLVGDADGSQLLRRLHAFAEATLAPGTGSSPALLALVRKLQDGLAAVESFPVQYSQLSPSSASLRFLGLGEGYAAARAAAADAGSLSAGLAALAQPFKLRLSRAPHERQLRDYSSNVVLIEPLATMAAVEEFLWPRVYRAEAVTAAATKPAAEGAEEAEAPASGSRTPGSAGAEAGAQAALRPGGENKGRPASAQGASPRARPAPADQPALPAELGAAAAPRMTRAQAARAMASTGPSAAQPTVAGEGAAALGGAARGREDPAAPDMSEEDNDIIMLQVPHHCTTVFNDNCRFSFYRCLCCFLSSYWWHNSLGRAAVDGGIGRGRMAANPTKVSDGAGVPWPRQDHSPG